MFTYRQLLIVATLSSIAQLGYQFLMHEPDFLFAISMIIGFYTLILNVWILELVGFFKDELTKKESSND